MLSFEEQEEKFGQLVIRARMDAVFCQSLMASPTQVLTSHGINPDQVPAMRVPATYLPVGYDGAEKEPEMVSGMIATD